MNSDRPIDLTPFAQDASKRNVGIEGILINRQRLGKSINGTFLLTIEQEVEASVILGRELGTLCAIHAQPPPSESPTRCHRKHEQYQQKSVIQYHARCLSQQPPAGDLVACEADG